MIGRLRFEVRATPTRPAVADLMPGEYVTLPNGVTWAVVSNTERGRDLYELELAAVDPYVIPWDAERVELPRSMRELVVAPGV